MDSSGANQNERLNCWIGDAPGVARSIAANRVDRMPMLNTEFGYEYLPGGGATTLDLSAAPGSLSVRWFNPRNGSFGAASTVPGGESHKFDAPDTNHAYEKTKPKQHPIGLTGHGSESNDEMIASSADWFSPGEREWPELKTNPRAVDGKKVSLLDTDHVYGVGGDQQWVWKAFLRGHNVLFVDPYMDRNWETTGGGGYDSSHENARKAMGVTRRYAVRMNLSCGDSRRVFVETAHQATLAMLLPLFYVAIL